MKTPFLRILKNGNPTGSYTFTPHDGVRVELCIPKAHRVWFYVGNDEKVLLQAEVPFSRFEGELAVYGADLDFGYLAPSGRGLFFFHFEMETDYGRQYTVCDGYKLSFADRFVNEFQFTLYDEKYPTPDWLTGGVFYHIFVDRFCKSGRSMRRTDALYNEDWENGSPEYPPIQGQSFPNNTHFGGDLYGVASKLDYLRDLGVTVLYLSPVADAYSNHKYDTGDYLTVDPTFGGDEALQELVDKAHAMGIRVILDGVFNHVGDDSIYFNRYGKYPTLGAYQSTESPYYSWFSFGANRDEYESWWGIRNLPRPRKCKEFRDFICKQVIPKYMAMGIDGYRLDVVDELESDFLDEIVSAVKSVKPDAAIIGEVWEDASNKIAYDTRKRYLQGEQLSGVMNYPFRNGLIAFLTEEDSSLLREVTETLYQHYPIASLAHTMNSIGTHDTERILTVLGGDVDFGEPNEVLANRRMTPEQRELAIQKLVCGYTLLACLPGVPCIYYGDEVGMEGYHDPFNRRPFPWHSMDTRLHHSFRSVNRLRGREELFRAEGFRVLNAPASMFVCQRFSSAGTMTAVSNASAHCQNWHFENTVTNLLTGETCKGDLSVPPHTTLIFKEL